MGSTVAIAGILLAGGVLGASGPRPQAGPPQKKATAAPKVDPVAAVMAEVEHEGKTRYVYALSPRRAARLAELVRAHKPKKVVECGTAIGYSGLWIARELKALGAGKLVTIEIDPNRAREARDNFQRAGLADFVDVRTGDATEVVKEIEGPVDFLFIDCNFANYHPIFVNAEPKLADGAVVVADNAGIAPRGMAAYLDLVRSRFDTRTEWFEIEPGSVDRDAFEVTVIRRKPKAADAAKGR